MRRWLLALTLSVGGCVIAPSVPLMVPLDAGADHGYSDTMLADRRYEVRYLTPPRRTALDPADRTADIEAARSLAYDLALWRAAAIAEVLGYPAFTVDQRDASVTVEITDQNPYYGPYYGDCRFAYPYCDYGYLDRPYGYLRDAWLQVEARLTVTLRSHSGRGTLDASATGEQMRRKHPTALEAGVPY